MDITKLAEALGVPKQAFTAGDESGLYLRKEDLNNLLEAREVLSRAIVTCRTMSANKAGGLVYGVLTHEYGCKADLH